MKKNLLADFELKDSPTFAESKTISRFMLQKFEEKQFDAVEIYYNRFVNTLSQIPTRTRSSPSAPKRWPPPGPGRNRTRADGKKDRQRPASGRLLQF